MTTEFSSGAIELSEHQLTSVCGGTVSLPTNLNQSISDAVDQILKSNPAATYPFPNSGDFDTDLPALPDISID